MAIEFSTFLATSVSSWDGEAPGSEAVTLAELGFVEVIVHRRLAPAGCEAGVEARFGAPAETNELGARWRIAQP